MIMISAEKQMDKILTQVKVSLRPLKFKPGDYNLVVTCRGIDERLGHNQRAFWLAVLQELIEEFQGTIEDKSDLPNNEVLLTLKVNFESPETVDNFIEKFAKTALNKNIRFGPPGLDIHAYRVVDGEEVRVLISLVKDWE